MSLPVRVLIGLVTGLAVGVLLASQGGPLARDVGAIAEPIGLLFFNALRMTVVPLVVASLIVGVASAPDPRVIGRLGWRTAAIFLGTLAVAATFAALVAAPLLSALPIDAAASAALRATATTGADPAIAEGAKRLPSLGGWLVDLVPANAVKAAADGAMLPLLVFTIAFGLALGRVGAERRAPVLGFFEGVADATMILVRWVLALAPFGVFALAIPLAMKVGLAAAGALAYYVVVVALGCLAIMLLLLLPLAVIGGQVPMGALLRSSAPALGVGFGTRSSMAALPAMIEGARRLGYPERISSFFLPLSATMFRVGGAVYYPVSALFVARLYGVTLGPGQLASIVVTSVFTTLAIPAVPGGSVIVMIPVLDAAGLPAQATALLFGVDTVPDMFRTLTNVAGHMTGATLLRRAAEEPAPVPLAVANIPAGPRPALERD